MKKLFVLLLCCSMIMISGAVLAEEQVESAEAAVSEEIAAAEDTPEAEALTEEVSEEEEREADAAADDAEKTKDGKKASKDKGEKAKDGDKGEKAKDGDKETKDKGEKSQDKGEKSKDNGKKSQDKGEKSKEKAEKDKQDVLGNGITKEKLRAKKEQVKTIHKEIKEYIKAEKELFKNADAEAREEILADIAAAKRELRDNTIGAFIKGYEVDFEQYDGVRPEIKNERTLVPVRAILEKYDAVLSWDGESKTITITKGDTVVVMTIDSDTATVNGEEVSVETAPTIKNNRTMVPIRFLSEQFNMDVQWDEESRMIIIEEKE